MPRRLQGRAGSSADCFCCPSPYGSCAAGRYGWTGGTGAGLPRFRIRRAGSRPVYIFHHMDGAAKALSDNILAETPDALCLFSQAGTVPAGDHSRIAVDMAPGDVLIVWPEDPHAPVIGNGEIRKLIGKVLVE